MESLEVTIPHSVSFACLTGISVLLLGLEEVLEMTSSSRRKWPILLSGMDQESMSSANSTTLGSPLDPDGLILATEEIITGFLSENLTISTLIQCGSYKLRRQEGPSSLGFGRLLAKVRLY